MIDIHGPIRREYSLEEQAFLKKKFFITLHSFLLLYLSLHNLILPLLSNTLRNEALYRNLHFWFFVHIPVNILLRRKGIPSTLFAFLVAGSVARVITECVLASGHLISWGVMSTIVTELATFIFYFFYSREMSWGKNKFFAGAFLGIMMATSMAVVEFRLLETSDPISSVLKIKSDSYGCEGSRNEIRYPLESKVKQSKISILDCGFEKDEIRIENNLVISNNTRLNLNLRIYRLKWAAGKISWKFLRLIPVGEGETLDLSSYLEGDMPIVIKIPERKKLGHLLAIPQESGAHFPSGKLTTTYDSVRWDNHE